MPNPPGVSFQVNDPYAFGALQPGAPDTDPSVLRAYQEQPNDYVTGLIASALSGLGAAQPGRQAYGQAQKFTDLLNWTPAGIPQAGYSAGQMMAGGAKKFAQSPSWSAAGQTGLGAGLGALALIPGLRAEAPELENAAFGALQPNQPSDLIGRFMADQSGAGRIGLKGAAAGPALAALPPVPARGAFTTLASPEAINAAAAETRKGITQQGLRNVYSQLGLTGGEPLDLVKPSLSVSQPASLVQDAIDTKLADRAMLHTLTPEQLALYRKKNKLPEGMQFPSDVLDEAATQAYEPVKKQVTRAERLFDRNPNQPAIFDLSADTLNKTPDVPQFNLPRVAPEASDRLASVARGGMARLERAAASAPPENHGWYNVMQMRDAFHAMHGPDVGEQAFQTWLDGLAGTSMVNPIDNNVRSSSWYLQQVMQGKPLPQTLKIIDPENGQTVRAMAGGPPAGYGAKSQIQHADRVQQYLTNTADPVKNAKPLSYRMNLGGNWMPRTVDTHDIRNMVGMPLALDNFGAEEASLRPSEYSYLESVGQRAADRAAIPQASQQAKTWIGGGDYTNLKSFPAPLMQVLNRRVHVTAAVRGQHPLDVLADFLRGNQPLL